MAMVVENTYLWNNALSLRVSALRLLKALIALYLLKQNKQNSRLKTI